MEIITKNAGETFEFGKKTAADLIKSGRLPKNARVLALEGDLGSGKTTFTQGFASGLGKINRIISPTFIIMKRYDLTGSNIAGVFTNLYHLDLYRLEEDFWQEVRNIGIEDVLSDPVNVIVIEWAEKIKNNLPSDTMWIKFMDIGNGERKIII